MAADSMKATEVAIAAGSAKNASYLVDELKDMDRETRLLTMELVVEIMKSATPQGRHLLKLFPNGVVIFTAEIEVARQKHGIKSPVAEAKADLERQNTKPKIH